MLSEIQIQNFALIDRLGIRFGPGLNALTGETGAGKSIVIDAIGIILGERAGADVIRSGADRAIVEASFTVDPLPGGAPGGDPGLNGSEREGEEAGEETSGDPLREVAEDGWVIVSRELSRSGRSTFRVNGRPSTLSMVRSLARRLIDLHGQHEHQALLDVRTHLEVLDGLAGPEAGALREEVAARYAELSRLESERRRLQMDERQRSRQIDLLRFQIDEIAAAKLRPDEEEALQADRVRLAGAEKLAAALEEAISLLTEQEASVQELLGTAEARLRSVVSLDADLESPHQALESSLIQVQEAARDLRAYRDAIEFNPERLAEIESRIDLLKGLKRKYGDTLEEVIAYQARASEELETLSSSEERAQELDAAIAEAESNLRAACEGLTSVRKRAIPGLEEAVQRELADLGMEKTIFEVRLDPKEPGPTGADDVEFLLSPNPGEPVKPLSRIASGGEISRIMLALKSVALGAHRAALGAVPTMIFDEIDVGIGGRTGTTLARKLRNLGETAQVICVSHLPQVAAAAHHHLSIRKTEADGRTRVQVTAVESDERTEEIARMLGGMDSRVATEHARQMLAALQAPPVPEAA